MYQPTALQAVAEEHDTPRNTLNSAPAGLIVVWMDQVVPFQASAKVTSPPPLLA